MKITLMNLLLCITLTLSSLENLFNIWLLICYILRKLKRERKFMERDWMLCLGFWILRIDLMVNICLLHQLVYLVLGLCNWLCMVLLVVFSAKIPVFFVNTSLVLALPSLPLSQIKYLLVLGATGHSQ